MTTPFDHSGSTFDSFLEEESILDEVEGAAIKRVIAWKLAEAMKAGDISKRALIGINKGSPSQNVEYPFKSHSRRLKNLSKRP
jgi:hypothetical protein